MTDSHTPAWGKVPYKKRSHHKKRAPGGQFGYSLPSQTFDMDAAYTSFRAMLIEVYGH